MYLSQPVTPGNGWAQAIPAQCHQPSSASLTHLWWDAQPSRLWGAHGRGLYYHGSEPLMLELGVCKAMLTAGEVRSFSTHTKCVSCTLSQICQKGKDFISVYWSVQQLPPSLSPCAPASQGKFLQQGSPKSHPDSSVVVPSVALQHKPANSPFSASV